MCTNLRKNRVDLTLQQKWGRLRVILLLFFVSFRRVSTFRCVSLPWLFGKRHSRKLIDYRILDIASCRAASVVASCVQEDQELT